MWFCHLPSTKRGAELESSPICTVYSASSSISTEAITRLCMPSLTRMKSDFLRTTGCLSFNQVAVRPGWLTSHSKVTVCFSMTRISDSSLMNFRDSEKQVSKLLMQMYTNVLSNKVKVIFNYTLKLLLYNSFWMKELQVNINSEVCLAHTLHLQCGFSRNITTHTRVFGSIINSDIS